MMTRRNLLGAGLLGGLAFASLRCARPVAPEGPGAGGANDEPPRTTDPEALVRLLEDTERDRLLEALAPEIHEGLDPDALAAAIFAAGTRNVPTIRQFGSEQHILLCVWSVHRATAPLPPKLRWRPLLWAADFFKSAQADASEYAPDPMPPLAESSVPGPDRALREFQEAMDAFDGPRAEAAIAGLHRSAPRELVIETLLRYGSKDFRHIGHKAIHVSNGLATLDVVGWQRAEEALRSIAGTMALHYEEKGRDVDGAWVTNQARLSSLRDDWSTGSDNDEAVRSLLATLRKASPDDASAEVARWSSLGVGPRSLWDAMLLSSAELLLDNPDSIEALHAVTASNAAYTAFERAKDDANRRLLLLQNAGRVADFHQYVAYWHARDKTAPAFDLHIETLEPAAASSSPEQALEEIFADLGQTPEAKLRAVKKTLGLLEAGSVDAERFFARTFEVAGSRANDSHDYKLPVAVMDDLPRLSPKWRPRYLAACAVAFCGSAEPANEIAARLDALGL